MKKIIILLIHALIGWALCGAIMGIGMSILPMIPVLIIHLIAAPVFFMIISAVYFKKFSYTSPFVTALIFTAFIVFMDFFVVSLLIMKNMEMFTNGFYSVLGTWIPFCMIFLTTYITGKSITG